MVEISQLPDDLLGEILKRNVNPYDRNRVSEVCKRWLTVEGLTRRSLYLRKLIFLRKVLPRFPNLVTFKIFNPISEEADLEFIAQTCSKLQVINLHRPKKYGYQLLPKNGLSADGGLMNLSNVSLRERRNGRRIRRWLHQLAPDYLTYLDLRKCCYYNDRRMVDDSEVEEIEGLCTRLTYLNLGHSHISDKTLRLLANARFSKTLRTLVLAHCLYITDAGVTHLQNMQSLEELDLQSCGDHVTDIGVKKAISENRSIKKLNLRNLNNVSDQSMVFVAENCRNLESLNISGTGVTSAGIRALSGHKCLETLVWCMYGEICWSDVEHMVLGCQSLKSIVLRKQHLNQVPASVSRIATFVD
ncbi:uncharacterized protein LOC126784257 [Argentina anserina]|uniref:uncharacterized protein LOC126784257 n=1 Tax=Argentina anserina TaxID=57926 RepID=UPI00217695BB|nr:uncharacterized protein LOC126784257 [Potentilla anserina]